MSHGIGLLKRALKATGLTQADFAPRIEVSPRTIARMLSGKRTFKPRERAKIRAILKESK